MISSQNDDIFINTAIFITLLFRIEFSKVRIYLSPKIVLNYRLYDPQGRYKGLSHRPLKNMLMQLIQDHVSRI